MAANCLLILSLVKSFAIIKLHSAKYDFPQGGQSTSKVTNVTRAHKLEGKNINRLIGSNFSHMEIQPYWIGPRVHLVQSTLSKHWQPDASGPSQASDHPPQLTFPISGVQRYTASVHGGFICPHNSNSNRQNIILPAETPRALCKVDLNWWRSMS